MLSGEALDLAFALRDHVGPMVQGDGPDEARLKSLTSLSSPALAAAVKELVGIGFIALERGDLSPDGPISRIVVPAPLQIYLDDLESQGSDDY